MKRKTESWKIRVGNKLADILGLKRVAPDRYRAAWGVKSALGVFETVSEIVK